MRFFSFGWASFALICLLLGCAPALDDDDDGDRGGGGGATHSGGASVAVQSCSDRCVSKILDCGADASEAASGCREACEAGLTEQQVSCIERASCGALAAGDPCGILGGVPAGGGGDVDPVGGGGGAGPVSSEPLGLGEACRCASDGDWVTCRGDGAPCQAGLTCVEYAGDSICTQACEADSACGAGLSCTILMLATVEMGQYCWGH